MRFPSPQAAAGPRRLLAPAKARPGVVLLGAALLAGCASPPAGRAPATTVVQPAAPAAAPTPPATPAAAPWQVSSEESLLTIEVLRGGPMAKLGHNHVIAARGLAGEVMLAEPLEASAFEVHLPVEQFSVDEPALRAAAGPDFSAPVPDSARVGTRANMLGGGLLDAQHYPEILLQSQVIRPSDQGLLATVRVSLRGARHDVTLPVALVRAGDSLTASGSFELRQSELGLTPFSVMMGALQVQDAMQVRFRIVAHPAAQPAVQPAAQR